MSAAKANKQRARAAEIRAEIERLHPAASTGHPLSTMKVRSLEKELAALRFKD